MLDRSELLDFLGLIAEHLQEEIILVAAGGTGLTLLDLKESTRDVDFTGPKNSIEAFQSALEKEPHGFKVDTWSDGWVFATHLPSDYLENSISIASETPPLRIAPCRHRGVEDRTLRCP